MIDRVGDSTFFPFFLRVRREEIQTILKLRFLIPVSFLFQEDNFYENLLYWPLLTPAKKVQNSFVSYKI